MNRTINIKKEALLLLLLMLAGMAEAQHSVTREDDRDDLAMENRAWVHMYRSDYDDTTYYQLGIKGDTVVNGLVYKKLIECSHLGFPIEGQCVGGIRTDGNGKYYFVSLPPLLPAIGQMYICMYQEQEVMLYDFSLSEWDYWYDPCPDAGHDIVLKVDEEEYNGVMRKVLWFDQHYQWIEGIGSNKGLMFPINDEVLLCGVSHRTVEVFQDGECIYKNPEFEGVDYTGVEEECHIERRFFIFPNPVKDELSLHYPSGIKPKHIELYDLQGRLVRTQRSNFESVDMSQLPAGTYTLRVTLEDGTVFSDKVVRE
jgi:hypothetical protein